jgi:O-antigen/teichoic acid export membrane protein
VPPEADAKAPSPLRRLLIRGAAGSMLTTSVSAAMLFAVQVALARMMGGAEYGLYSSVQAWVNIAAVVCLFGMDLSVLRFLPQYQVREEWAPLKGFLRLAGRLHWSLSLLAAGAWALAVWIVGSSTAAGGASAFLLGAVLLPLLVRTRMSGAVLRGLKHVVLAQSPELLLRPMAQVATMGAVFAIDRAWATAVAGRAAWRILKKVVFSFASVRLPIYKHMRKSMVLGWYRHVVRMREDDVNCHGRSLPSVQRA